MDKFLKVFSWVVITLLQLMLTMFTISTVWGWFIVPLGAPVIGWAQAYGLSLIIAYLTFRMNPAFKTDLLQTLTFGQRVGRAVGLNIGLLIIGYIGTLFM